jgi:hypothetical protein
MSQLLRTQNGTLTRVGCVWVVTALIGLLLAAVSVLALVDPEGTKMADDADPFGTPPSRMSSLIRLGVAALLVVWPVIPLKIRRKHTDGSSGESSGTASS